jgi:alpha-D-xyloside xylohydrolase
MLETREADSALVFRRGRETLTLQAWGRNTIRVRATLEPKVCDQSWALVSGSPASASVEVQKGQGVLSAGLAQATIDADGHVRFLHSGSGEALLEEIRVPRAYETAAREYRSLGSHLFRIALRFQSHRQERFYGLGQHQHALLNLKGSVTELVQRNTEVAIPFLLSNRGYGFLWNNPAVGKVELAENGTTWLANRSRQIDYLVIAGDSPSAILSEYAELTGHTPMMPEWAAGFWQSKLRYETQGELLAVAEEYKRRGLPLSVIVIDYFHWTRMGEWRFDPDCWPDPESLVRKLEALGVKVMVSIWPTVSPLSENLQEMQEKGYLVQAERGLAGFHPMPDTNVPDRIPMYFYDPTYPEAGRYVWEKVRKNYYDRGIRIWWLDACEPEMRPNVHSNLRYYLGNGEEVGCIYPFLHEKAFYEGMKDAGEREVFMLCRSAWAGSQRFGVCVWSGDVESSFESLQAQVRAGLNMALSGIPWWTTDIGGFYGGNIEDPSFRELLIRWFQYGVFCPLFRLHGVRLPLKRSEQPRMGADNEVWCFGEKAYHIITALLLLRERLKPYILAQMKCASDTGVPPMRPLFVDFPADAEAWAVDDEFLFGWDILVAPVLEGGQRQRSVYLPSGATWRDAWSNQRHTGGRRLDAEAPLERIPVYLRGDADLPIRG